MSAILTADLHLTDNPKDEYRWGIFEWLLKEAKENKSSHIFIIGDLVDAKNGHSAEFMDRIRKSFEILTNNNIKIGYIIGNHDGISENYPFFEYLELIKNVRIYKEPTFDDNFYSHPIYCLPYIRDEKKTVETILKSPIQGAKYCFAHITLLGSKTSVAPLKQGINAKLFDQVLGENKNQTKVFAGDIHVPQKISNNVEYIGSPYPIHLNDRFVGRCIVLSDDKQSDIFYPTIKKDTIVLSGNDSKLLNNFTSGDQIKVRIELNKSDIPDWDKYRKNIIEIANKKGIELCGVELLIKENKKHVEEKQKNRSNEDFFLSYCKNNNLGSEEIEIGQSLL